MAKPNAPSSQARNAGGVGSKRKAAPGKDYTSPKKHKGMPDKATFKDKRYPSKDANARSKPSGGQPMQFKSRKEHKEAVLAKKLALKKNYNIIHDAVPLWEKLRPKELPTDERTELVTEILGKAKGKLVELSNHHTASRIIQFCVKYGTPAERKFIMEEVKAKIVDLAKSKYGHHLVQKLITVSSKEEVPDLVRMFRGHVAELLRQAQGADVVDDLYNVANTAQRNMLCAEFYGKEYVLFDGVSGDASQLGSLQQLLAGASSSKRRAVIQHMSKALIPIMEKALLHPAITHRLVLDFLQCAPSLSVEDAVDTLSQTGESLLRMVHTHEGAGAAAAVLSYGTAKDRKHVVKALKGHVKNMAVNEWGHIVLCAVLRVVDDTTLVNKVVTSELKELLSELVADRCMSRVLLSLLCPDGGRYFAPHVRALLSPPQRSVRGSTGKTAEDAEGDAVEAAEADDLVAFHAAGEDAEEEDLFSAKGSSKEAAAGGKKAKASKQAAAAAAAAQAAAAKEEETAGPGPGSEDAEETGPEGERVLGLSKKAPAARRRELLGPVGPKGIGTQLAALCAARAGSLVRHAVGCDVVLEVARGGQEGVLAELAPDAIHELHDALLAQAARGADDVHVATPDDDEEEEGPSTSGQQEHILLQYFSSRTLRRLVLYATEQGPGGELARQFSQRLWKEVLSGHCKQWVGTHAEKVLAAVLHADPAIRKAAQAELAPLIKPKSVDEWIGQFVGKDHHLRSGDVKKEKAKAVPSPVQQQQQTPKQHQGKAVTPAPAAAKTPGKGVTPAKPVKQKQQQTPEGKASGGKRPAAQPAVSAGKHHATPKSANKAKN